MEKTIKDFEQKFKAKTQNDWSIKNDTIGQEWKDFQPKKGSYTVVETDDVEGGDG